MSAADILQPGHECVEASAPGVRYFVWRARDDRIHALRATRGRRANVTLSLRAVRPENLDTLLAVIGIGRPASELKWTPASRDEALRIICSVPAAPEVQP